MQEALNGILEEHQAADAQKISQAQEQITGSDWEFQLGSLFVSFVAEPQVVTVKSH